MLLGGLFVCPLVCREVIASSESLPAVALVIPLLQVNCVNVHLHVGTLTKISLTIIAHPFFLSPVRSGNMPFQ